MLEGCIHQRVPVPFSELFLQNQSFTGKVWYEGLEIVNQAYEGLKFKLGVGSGKVLQVLDIGGIRSMPCEVKMTP